MAHEARATKWMETWYQSGDSPKAWKQLVDEFAAVEEVARRETFEEAAGIANGLCDPECVVTERILRSRVEESLKSKAEVKHGD